MRPLLLLSLVVSIGCDPSVFGDLEDGAQIRDLEKPDSYPVDGFARVVHGFDGTLNGMAASRVAITGGAGTPTLVFPIWDGDALSISAHVYDVCDDPNDCGVGTGAAVAGVGTWRGGLMPDELCVAIGAPDANEVLVRCEVGTLQLISTPPGAIGFGASLAATGLAMESFGTLGGAIAGAPQTNGGAGAIYRVLNSGSAVEIDVSAATLVADSQLGRSVAAVAVDADTVWIAAGAPVAGRVLVFVLEPDGMGMPSTQLRACLEDPSPQYGQALAFGDVTGDGLPELFVGGAADAAGRLDGLHMHTGTGLPVTEGCQGWVQPRIEIACPATAGIDCTASGFGSALAVGDVDADSDGDLVVGAPFSTVDGQANAGALYVIPSNGSDLDPANAKALTHSNPDPDDELGRSVTTVRTVLDGVARHEPVGGAPGRNDALVFLCSGLASDSLAVGPRCIPP